MPGCCILLVCECEPWLPLQWFQLCRSLSPSARISSDGWLASLAVLVAVAAVFDSLVLCSVMSQWPSCVDVFVLDDISESEQCSFQRKWCVMHLTPLGCHEQRCARASANPIIIQPTTGAHSTFPSSVHWALVHWSWSSTTIWDAFPANNHLQWLLLINSFSQLQGIVTFYSNQSRLASCTQEYT